MDNFDRLEERVRKTVEVVKRLRKENGELQAKLHTAEKAQGASAEAQKHVEGLEKELKALKAERGEVKDRIARLVEVLENLD